MTFSTDFDTIKSVKRGDKMRDISKNIRDSRLEKNMTQDQLADKLFVTRQTVSNYENGKSRPDIDMIERIAEILETDVNTIIYGRVSNELKKREFIKLAVGALLIAVTIALYEYLVPIAMNIRATHYLSAGRFFIEFTLNPLKWLLTGWTVMQLAGIAFKTRITLPQWTKYIRYFLIIIILLYFTVIVITMLPVTVENHMYLVSKRNGGNMTYTTFLPQWYTTAGEWILDKLIGVMHFPRDLTIPVFLTLGMSLWLCGFSQTKKSKSEEKI